MLDLGANTETEFSPIQFTKKIWKLERLNFLSISHPHVDHIRDILSLQLLPPFVVSGPTILGDQLITEQIEEADRDLLEAYLDLKRQYSGPIPASELPYDRTWGDPAYFSQYWTDADWQKEPNNTSFVTFYKAGKFTLLYPGDIELRGWNQLLKESRFVEDLQSTSVFIASHHGREAGFSKAILEKARPLLVVISDSRFKDTSITGRYSSLASGFPVTNDNSGAIERRKVVSTRADGRVIIDVSDQGVKTTAEVRVKKSVND
jgi:competence protein ComEC